ncbi:hypothetical protein SUGI_0451490 [Cryptomeria japonica]|nr:hypothetical protein SUGI_0451490 [Cryptomeria japonica]
MCNQEFRIGRKEIRWKTPNDRFSKLNFDGAARGNPRILGIGCVIKDQEGKILVAGYGRILNGSNKIAEEKVLLLGIKLEIKNKANNIIIKGDSQNIIYVVLKKQTPNWQLDYIIQEERELIHSLVPYQIVHCYREANRLADILANLGCDQELTKVVLSQREFLEIKTLREQADRDAFQIY